MIKESVRMSWNNIIHNKMRTFLTILGVMIGVASIIALITIVQSATDNVMSQMSTLGADKITIRITGTLLKKGLLDSDIEALQRIDNVAGVSPSLNSISSITNGRDIKPDVEIQGRNEVYFAKTQDIIQSGRGINKIDLESKNRVCLIGQNILKELFYGHNPIGEKIKIGGIDYTIIGTLQRTNGFSMNNNNDTIIIPYTTAMSLLSMPYINDVDVYMENKDLSDKTTSYIEAVLSQAFNEHEDTYSIFNMQTIVDMMQEMTNTLSMMLAGIASISLIVGGIGIMNMMLVSVTERTKEIGLRKALGAEPRRIQELFLIEAIFLSGFGGIIGIFIGGIIAYIGCTIIDVSFKIAPSTILLAIGFSLLIGIVFGIAPARKASKLNPIDALRSV